ncbi:capsid protein [Enterobacter phage EC151]|nr:capsid protein [Enterobacter phage EC151]
MSRIVHIPGFAPVRLGATDMTRIADIVVPEVFAGYVQTLTQEKSRLVQSSALVMDERLSANLVGGGLTFNEPFYHDLLSTDGDHAENISTDNGPASTPDKIQAATEIQIRMSRNKSWGSADLTAALAGNDPMDAIANRVADWRVRRLQMAWLATMKGVFNTNDAAPANGSTHTQKDLTLDISSLSGDAAKFSASAFISATGLMGDSMGQLTMVMMHSIVYQQLQRLNLIDFIPDARGEVNIPFYQGREVIVDDGMPNTGGVFHTYLIGAGATALGTGSPKMPVEVQRNPEMNNGAGEEILYNRWEWIIHPVGHAWKGSAASKGGPSNVELATAGAFTRVFRERKQIRIARLITKEV